jgi:hypothetical protein
MPQTTPAGRDHSAASFSFPAVLGKKVTAGFDGGRLTSDGGVLVLAQAERMMGICRRLAACLADPRDPSRVVHRLEYILRARMDDFDVNPGSHLGVDYIEPGWVSYAPRVFGKPERASRAMKLQGGKRRAEVASQGIVKLYTFPRGPSV